MMTAPALGHDTYRVSGRTVASSAAWRAIETAGSELVSFLVFTMLARLLAPDQFGVVALAGSVMMILQGLLYSGFTEALVQRAELDDRHLQAVQAATFLLAVALVALGALIAWPLSRALGRTEFVAVFAALLPSLLLRACMGSMLAALRRQFHFRAIAIRTLAGVIAAGAVAIWLAQAGAGYWALVAQQWAAEIVGFCILVYVSPAKPWRMRWNRSALNDILPVALPVMGAHLMTNAARRLDIFALGLFLGNYEVGLYFMVYRLVFAAQMVAQHGLGEVAMVVLSRLQSTPDRQRSGTISVLQAIGIVCCAAFGGLAVAGPQLLPVLFGNAWAAAGGPLKILAVMAPAGGIVATCGVVLVAAGHARRFGLLAAAAALIQLVAVLAAAPWGLSAVAWAAGVSQVVAMALALVFVSKHIGIEPLALLRAMGPVIAIYALALAVGQLAAGTLPVGVAGLGEILAFALTMLLSASWRFGSVVKAMLASRS